MQATIEKYPIEKLRYIPKPKKYEYPPYSKIYMELLSDDGRVLYHLLENFKKIKDFIYALPEEKLRQRYTDANWSIKELLTHIINDERIFACRAQRCVTFGKTTLDDFEQDDYSLCPDAGERSLDSIFEEYATVRHSTIVMFNGFPDEALMRSGVAIGGISNRTVRAVVYHIAGHELWHMKILKEHYLNVPTEHGIL